MKSALLIIFIFLLQLVLNQYTDGQRIYYKYNDGLPVTATYYKTGALPNTCSCSVAQSCNITSVSNPPGNLVSFVMIPNTIGGTCTLSTEIGNVFLIAIVGNFF
jgi:hypothetical protein